MNYDEFKKRFPSEELLLEIGFTKEAFTERFIQLFERHGPAAVVSDVGIQKLLYSGAATRTRRGKWKIVREKLDLTERYKAYCDELFDIPLGRMVSLGHDMRVGMHPIGPISMNAVGNLSFSDTTILVSVWCFDYGVDPPFVVAALADARKIIGADSLQRVDVGTYTVEGDTLIYTPNPDYKEAGLGDPSEEWEQAVVVDY